MRFIKWVFIFIVTLIALVIGVGFMLPDQGHAERSIVIDAPPATVFTVLNGFRQFQKWSPWAGLDPNARVTTTGPVMGVGAKQAWASDDPSVGTGSQEIVESRPNEYVKVRLVFGDFTSDNAAAYTLTPEGQGTRVLWSYDTDAKGNVMYRYFAKLSDRMLGPDYEKGLAQLKALVVSLPKDDFSDVQIDLVDVTARPVAQLEGLAPLADLPAAIGERYAKIQAFITANGLQMTDAPIASRHLDEATGYWKYVVGIPVDRADVSVAPDSEVQMSTSYAGQALRAVHRGPYSALEPTYRRLMAYATAAGLEDNGNAWEHYVTDPVTTPEDQLVTHVYWPVK